MDLGAVFSNNSPANHVWINADLSQKVSWVREKLPDRNVTNFAKDWKDALLIRELVNATQPGLIPPKLYADKSNGEGNAKLGMQIAHDTFEIPQVISPFDWASGQLDELGLLLVSAILQVQEPPQRHWELKMSECTDSVLGSRHCM